MAAITYKCPNCGGELVFDPDLAKYKCPFCNSIFTQEELDRLKPSSAKEQKAEEDTQENSREETGPKTQESGAQQSTDAVIYTCPSCGAQIVTDDTTAATFCYYCHNPVVLTGKLSGRYLPDKVIPFKIGKKKAQQQFGDFIKSKKFVPKEFWNDRQIQMLSGVYYPYWEYDGEYQSQMSASCKNVRVWVAGDTEYTETSVFDVERSGQVQLKDMLNNALKKSNKELVENVQPFVMKEAESFNMSYLSGFVAEKRDMEKDEFESSVQTEAKECCERMLRDTISGYEIVDIRQSSSVPVSGKWSYVLLPVWVLTYRGRNNTMYYFAMNGQTGKVCGKLPVDNKKLFLVSLLLGLIIFAIAFLGGYLLF